MNTLAIIQARMNSSRLPGKVLADIAGQPMLWHVVSRAAKTRGVDEVVVATSTSEMDDPVAEFCSQSNIVCFRGDSLDVLDRYFKCAESRHADYIVRLTADCPLLDPDIIEQVLKTLSGGEFDYVSNTIVPTFPDGLDAEAFSFVSLSRAWSEAKLPSEREHVTPYLWKNPQLFRLRNVTAPADWSSHRWTVDEQRDLDFVRAIYQATGTMTFGLHEVLKLLEDRPDLACLNGGIKRNEGYEKSLLDENQKPFRSCFDGPGQKLYREARKRIPGGTQLLSKRPEMFLPELWPAYYSKAQGVHVWDLAGNRYVDMSYNGIGACILGAADPDVDAAVKNAIERGTMSTLNAPEEVELADLLCAIHPWSEMVRFARSGGEAMCIAVRIARAHTGKDTIAFCGYHGWHDWYLAANLAEDHALDGHLLPGLSPAGVPRGLLGTALPFQYNHIEELAEISKSNRLAAVVMEPIRNTEPEPGFLEAVRKIADAAGAVLIFDEITSGFRLNSGGAHLNYAVNPDVAVFAKAIGNGYPIAAILGVGKVMSAAQDSFISSTNWTERVGLVAALATIKKHRAHNAAEHLIRMGELVCEEWATAARPEGLEIEISGIRPLSHFHFTSESSRAMHTLFTQLMLERGYLATKAFYATYAHTPEHVRDYGLAVREVFSAIAKAVRAGTLEAQLRGPIAHDGFRRLT
jgi:glutamate-1-semialdehyde aminotransferase/spore coat polysaccharide biosynthesis protein SpsF (cytidylyltransferase family)